MHKSLTSFTSVLLFAGILAVTQSVRGQGFDPNFDEDCNPIVPTIPAQCQSIADQIEALNSDLSLLQADLIKFPNRKATILRQIRALEARIRRQITALEVCKQQNAGPAQQGRPIAASELTETFNGTATLRTSHPRLSGPFVKTVSIGLLFSKNRCTVKMTNFPQIDVTIMVPVLGQVTVNVTKTDGGEGQFHPITGRMMMPLKLHFKYPIVRDDDAWFFLTTESSVSPTGVFNVTGQKRQPDGSITLVGTTSFVDGYLSPNDGSLVIAGKITQPGGGVPLSPQCQQIADEIAALEKDIEGLQELLITASPSAKPQINQQISALQAQLSQKQTALRNCK